MKKISLVTVFLVMWGKAFSETLLEGLSVAINETPCSAIVEIIDIQTKIDADAVERKSIVKAKVLTPIRGNLPKVFEYIEVTDTGDYPPEIGKNLIMAFCKDNDEIYFAGVGASFEATKDNAAKAIEMARLANKNQVAFEYCD